jgi:hypothetical protein
MNRITGALLLVLLFFKGLNAQEVIYSEYQPFDLHGGDYSVVGKVGGRLYTYRSTGGEYFLDAYNDSMNRTATVILDFFPKKIYETRFVISGNNIIALYQSVEGNKVVQYAALLDEKGRLQKGPVQLSDAKTGVFGPTRSYFSSAVSDDKQTIVVYSAEEKGEQITFDGKWIDNQLNITHRNHALYKGDGNDLSHSDAIVTNDGTLFMPVYTPVGGKEFSDQFWMLSLPATGGKFSAAELPMSNTFIANVYVKLDNYNNRIYTGGFYSDKKNGNYIGVLYAYYDIASGSFMNKKTLPFDARLINATGERSKKHAFNDFKVRQLIVKNDGGFVLIAEEYFVNLRSSYTPGWGYYSWYAPTMATNVREYHYNDVLALSYDGNGNKEWDAFVRKDQYSQEDGGMFSSYALLNSGGTLAFLYNDFNTSRSRIQLATIDGTGNVNMRSFNPDRYNDADWLPSAGKQVSAREMVVPCLKRKQICFAKIVF